MWSRVGGVAISRFDRYYFWTVQKVLKNVKKYKKSAKMLKSTKSA